uniref:Uncharacterized protein n=1 Tax=Anguilla anguilla TaxID=7936 RepID=A0A0E9SRD5_ANGAN
MGSSLVLWVVSVPTESFGRKYCLFIYWYSHVISVTYPIGFQTKA